MKQDKLKSYSTSLFLKYSYQGPCNYEEAMELEKRYGSTWWSYATKTEMGYLDKYDTFKDLGKYAQDPVGHNNIWLCLLYDVDHDGHKSPG